MSLKAVANNPATGNHGTGGAAPDHSETAASTIDPQTATPDLPVPEALAIRMPVDIRSAALTVLAVLAIVLVLQYAQAMIIPIVLAVLISYALEPVIAWLERRHVPRSLGAAVVLLSLAAAGGWLLYGLRSQATAIVEQLPQAARRFRQSVESDRPTAASAIQQVQKAATELERAANSATPPPPPTGIQRVQVETPPIKISDYLMWGSLGVVAAVGQLALILFLGNFLLSSGDLYRRKLVKIAGPSLTDKRVTVQILQEIDRQIEMFLIVEVFTSLVVGLATWLAFRALGVEQAAVWGAAGGPVQLDPVLRTGDRHRRYIGRRLPPVRQPAHGDRGRRRVVGHHKPRRVPADAVADQPRDAHERRRHLRGTALLGLGLERLGDAAGGADADGDESRLRSRRRLQGNRRAPRRLTNVRATTARRSSRRTRSSCSVAAGRWSS